MCCSRRGLRTQYIRETFSLSCFRRHVPFLGFSGVDGRCRGTRWLGAIGIRCTHACLLSPLVRRSWRSSSPLRSVYSSCMHASRTFSEVSKGWASHRNDRGRTWMSSFPWALCDPASLTPCDGLFGAVRQKCKNFVTRPVSCGPEELQIVRRGCERVKVGVLARDRLSRYVP